MSHNITIRNHRLHMPWARVLGPLLLLCGLPLGLQAADWQVTMASLWGDQNKQEFTAVAVDSEGIAYVGGSPYRSIPGLDTWDLSEGRGGGIIVAIDSALGEAVAVLRLPGNVSALDVNREGHLLVLAGGVHKLDLHNRRSLWRASGGGRRILDDHAGGAWTFDGRNAVHFDDQGQQQRSLALRGADLAVDPAGQRLFTCGHSSGRSTIKERNPVHVPWVRAFDFDGERLWQMWGFTPTQVDEVGDMADSHPQRLFFSPNGHLYMFGDSDGGNTAYRHSPHSPGGSLGDALKGTAFNQMWRAFRSVRMLFVCRINPDNGDILRGSFFYGMWYNEEAQREEIGDAEAKGLYVDHEDRVYLTGIMRCTPPYTTNAVHKQSAPVDRRGYWNNRVATDEAYLAIIDNDFTRLAFCSGFNQNGSAQAWSRGLAVAAGGNAAVMAGTMRAHDQYPSSKLSFQRAGLQDSWGGNQDGYFAVLRHGAEEHGPVTHIHRTLQRIFPSSDDAWLNEARESKIFQPLLERLGNEDDPLAQRLGELLQRLGENSLSRAVSFLSSNPYITQQSLREVSRAWAGNPIAENAEEQLKALRGDPKLSLAITVGKAKAEAMAILDNLQPVPQAKEASLLDRAYAQRNGRVLQRFQQAALRMNQQWPEHEFTCEVLDVAANYAIPITEKDHQMVEHYGALIQLERRLRSTRGVTPHYDDATFRAMNQQVLKEMGQAVQRLRRADRRHPFTRAGENIAATYGIP